MEEAPTNCVRTAEGVLLQAMQASLPDFQLLVSCREDADVACLDICKREQPGRPLSGAEPDPFRGVADAFQQQSLDVLQSLPCKQAAERFVLPRRTKPGV